MGQKINSNSFRLGINQSWNSLWACDKNFYAGILHEDINLTKYLTNVLETSGYFVGDCFIQRSYLNINIYLMLYEYKKSGIVKDSKLLTNNNTLEDLNINNLKKNLEKLTSKSVVLYITNATSPFNSPLILSKIIATYLENSKDLRLAVTSMLKNFKKEFFKESNIIGLKILCAGRIQGRRSKLADVQWMQVGSISLQTIKNSISYGYSTAFTKYGTCGVKVWICYK